MSQIIPDYDQEKLVFLHVIRIQEMGHCCGLNSTSQVQTEAFCCRDDVRHYKTVFNQLNYT